MKAFIISIGIMLACYLYVGHSLVENERAHVQEKVQAYDAILDY